VPTGTYLARNRMVGNEAIRGTDQAHDRHGMVDSGQTVFEDGLA
jgi:hypothetical protein